MTWVAYFVFALESLVIVPSLWIMWVMISEASRAPADPSAPVEHPPERSLATVLADSPRANGEDALLGEDEDLPALFALERVDERGYARSRKLRMGCAAAVCRTPFGARIVAGRHALREPQYAWDYADVRVAEKALVRAEFDTHPSAGIVGVEDAGRGCSPAAEPEDYFRKWRYTLEGQLERF